MSNMMRFLLVSLILVGVLVSGYTVLAGGNEEVVVTEATCQPSDCAAKCDPGSCTPDQCRPSECPRR